MPSPTYVSSSGTLSTQPLTTRLGHWAQGNLEVVWLFFETLVSPVVNPASWADPSATRPPAATHREDSRLGNRSNATDHGRGGGSGGVGGGSRGSGGNGRFMSMNDLRGGGTVDGCRATCG